MGRYDHTTSAFGFSPKTKKYKVLQLFLKFVSYESETYEAEAEIYTLGEGPWRSLGRVPFHPDSQSFYASSSGALDWFNHSFYASLNGAFHWLTFDRASPDFIRCFDFDSERFHVEVSRISTFMGSNRNSSAGHIPSFVPLPDVAKGERLTMNCLRPRMSALTRLEIALQKIVDGCCESSSRALPVVPTVEECMAKLSSMPQFSQNNEMRVKCKNLFANSDDGALFMACPDDERRYYFIHQACPVTIKECMVKLSSIPEFSQNNELWAKGANLFRHSKNRALFMACPDDEKSCYPLRHIKNEMNGEVEDISEAYSKWVVIQHISTYEDQGEIHPQYGIMVAIARRLDSCLLQQFSGYLCFPIKVKPKEKLNRTSKRHFMNSIEDRLNIEKDIFNYVPARILSILLMEH
ncbi:hypothetical protein C3L33_12079, partial [Rhododendron williamsianum]